MDADDVGRFERALIYPGGRDPHIAVFVQNGKVAAGCGGHPVAVDAFHNRH
jgi:hypothetical protein